MSAASAQTTLVAIDVSFGSALLPAPLKRLLGKNGSVQNIQPLPSAQPVYIWAATAEVGAEAEAVLDIQLLVDDQAVPEGYKKVNRDLSAGATKQKTYLAYKLGPPTEEVKPLEAITVLAEGDTLAEGFVVLERPLSTEGTVYRLAVKRLVVEAATESAETAAWLDSLKAGDTCDCLSRDKHWRLADIVSISADRATVSVTFKGWPAKYNETVPRSSKRLAKMGRHTAGKDTRALKQQGASFKVDIEVLRSLEEKIDMVIAGEFPEEERDTFCKGELPNYLAEVLSAKYATADVIASGAAASALAEGLSEEDAADALRDRIAAFTTKLHALSISYLKKYDQPLPPEALQHIARLYLLDEHCNYFFMQYGRTQPGDPDAAKLVGRVGKLPTGGASRYWVQNLNETEALGGFEAVIGRMQWQTAALKAAQAAQLAAAQSKASGGSDAIPPAIAAAAAAATMDEENPLHEVETIATAMCMGKFCTTPWWAMKYYARMRDAFLDRMLALSVPQLKKVSPLVLRNIPAELVSLGRQLLQSVPANSPDRRRAIIMGEGADPSLPLESFDAPFERARMRLAVQLLRCDSLALRVKGITDIRDTVAAVEKEEDAKTAAARAASAVGGGKVVDMAGTGLHSTFTRGSFLAFLRDHHVVELVLGGSAGGQPPVPVHNAVVSRTQAVLTFIAKALMTKQRLETNMAVRSANGQAPSQEAQARIAELSAAAITPAHLQLLWKLLLDEGDDTRRVVLEIVKELSENLPRTHLDVLYSCFASVPLHKYDELTVIVLASFTENALKRMGEELQSARLLAKLRRGEAAAAADADADAEAEAEAGAAPLPTGDAALDAIVANPQDFHHWYGIKQLWDLCQEGTSTSSATAASVSAVSTESARSAAAAPAAAAATSTGAVSVTSPTAASASGAGQLPSFKVVDEAMDMLKVLLTPAAVQEQLTELLEVAIKNIKDSRAALANLRLLHKLLPVFDGGNMAAAAQIVEHAHQVLPAMLAEVHSYKAAAAAAAAKQGLTALPVSTPAEQLTLVGRHSHAFNLSFRLDVLAWYAGLIDENLSAAAVTRLFADCATAALTTDEAEMFFTWLFKSRFAAVNDPAKVMMHKPVIDNDTVVAVFNTLFAPQSASPSAASAASASSASALSPAAAAAANGDVRRFDVTALGPKGFACFDAFFRMTNSLGGALTGSMTIDGTVGAAMVSRLQGLPQVWDMACHATDDAVAQKAQKLLIALHVAEVGGGASEGDTRAGVWTGFVGACMDRLASLMEAATAPAASSSGADAKRTVSPTRAISRVMQMLQTFLAELAKLGETEEETGPTRGADGIIRLALDGPELPQLHIETGTAVVTLQGFRTVTTMAVAIRPKVESQGSLRARIADSIGTAPNCVRLMQSQRILHCRDDAEMLDNVLDGTRITVQAFEAPSAADCAGAVAMSQAQRTRAFVTAAAAQAGVDPELLMREVLEEQEVVKQMYQLPRRQLTENADYFDRLFSLLSLREPALVAEAWRLISSLPVSDKLREDILTLRGRVAAGDGASSGAASVPDGHALPWDTLLDSAAPPKLLYALQIIVDMLNANNVDANEVAESSRDNQLCMDAAITANSGRPAPQFSGCVEVTSDWGKAFIAHGGLAHLHRLVMTMPLQSLIFQGSSLEKECAKLLLSLYSRFMVGPHFSLRSFPGCTPDRAALVQRMMEWMSYVTTVPSSNAGEEGSDAAAAAGQKGGSPQATPPRAGGAGAGAAGAAGAMDDDDDDIRSSGANGKDNENAADNKKSVEEEILVQLSDVLLAAVVGPTVAAEADKETAEYAATYGSNMPPQDFSRFTLHPEALRALYNMPHAAQVVCSALLVPADRVRLATFVYVLRRLAMLTEVADKTSAVSAFAAGDLPTVHAWLSTTLLSHVSVAYYYPSNCRQFFALLTTALEGQADAEAHSAAATASAPPTAQDVATLSTLAKLITTHPVVEVGTDASDVCDYVLQGLLTVLATFLRAHPALKATAAAPTTEGGHNLLQEVFRNCLFATPGERVSVDAVPSVLGGHLPKCKQKPTRRSAFDLLTELAKDNVANAVALCKMLLPHHDSAAGDAAVATVRPGAPAVQLDDDEDDKAKDKKGAQKGAKGAKATDAKTGEKESILQSGRSRNLVPPRNSTGYVGLRNLGCICYMNSTVQQFFMNPRFRRAVLSYAEPGTDAAELADSIMYQLQRQFAYLQESDKAYYVPKGLCGAIKDWDGNPTDVLEQKDVPEFLGKLFSDMETQLQGTPLANLPKDVYGGLTMQELIADDPRGDGRAPLYGHRDEDFYFLQVRIKNHSNLHEALQAFVSGETVEFKWTLPEDAPEGGATAGGGGAGAGAGAGAGGEKPAEKKPEQVTVKTTKRVSVKTVSDHLMVNLSRFEFDLDTMQQAKLNDRFEFPRTLDMWPYSVYGRPDAAPAAIAAATGGAAAAADGSVHHDLDRDNYLYELVGVVIHLGTAIGGHYYSYIRERGPDGPSSADRWFEFNDALVSRWDATDVNIERDCFGGKDVFHYPGGVQWVNGVYKQLPPNVFERARIANAFILFYDRIKKKPSSGVTGATAAEGAAASGAAASASAATASSSASKATANGVHATGPQPALVPLPADPYAAFAEALKAAFGGGSDRVRLSARAPVPPSIMAAIAAENTELWRLRTIFDDAYFNFVQSVLRTFASSAEEEGASASASAAAAAAAVPYPVGGITSVQHAMSLGGDTMYAVRLLVAFMLNTLGEVDVSTIGTDWSLICDKLFSRNMVAAVWMLQSLLADAAGFKKMLFADITVFKGTRVMLATIVSSALRAVWAGEMELRKTGAVTAAAPAADTTYTAPAGHVAEAMVDFLIAQLPTLHKHYMRFSQLFEILLSFGNSSVEARALLLSRTLLSRLIDFLLCGDSPHPELNAVPEAAAPATGTATGTGGAAAGGGKPGVKKVRVRGEDSSDSDEDDGMGSTALLYSNRRTRFGNTIITNYPNYPSNIKDDKNLDYAEFSDLRCIFLLLRMLALSCLPPSGQLGSAHQLEPACAISPIDAEMLLCRKFFAKLVPYLRSGLVLTAFRPLLEHMAYGQMPPPPAPQVGAQGPTLLFPPGQKMLPQPPGYYDNLPADNFVAVVLMFIRQNLRIGETGHLASQFKLLNIVCSLEAGTERQAARVDFMLRGLLQEMWCQQRLHRSTETNIYQLILLAHNNAAVAQWLHEHAGEWAWCLQWVRAYPQPPPTVFGVAGEPGVMRAFRSVQTAPMSYMYVAPTSTQTESMLDGEVVHNIRRVMRGKPVLKTWLADDESILTTVGKRIRIYSAAVKTWVGGNIVEAHTMDDSVSYVHTKTGQKAWGFLRGDRAQPYMLLPPEDAAVAPEPPIMEFEADFEAAQQAVQDGEQLDDAAVAPRVNTRGAAAANLNVNARTELEVVARRLAEASPEEDDEEDDSDEEDRYGTAAVNAQVPRSSVGVPPRAGVGYHALHTAQEVDNRFDGDSDSDSDDAAGGGRSEEEGGNMEADMDDDLEDGDDERTWNQPHGGA